MYVLFVFFEYYFKYIERVENNDLDVLSIDTLNPREEVFSRTKTIL